MNDESLTAAVRRTFSSPRQKVFQAFSSAENIAHWLTPDSATKMTVLAMTFEHQGSFRFRYDEPDGGQEIVGGIFQLIQAPGKIIFSWTWEAPNQFAGIDTQVTVEFIEQGSQTEVILTHRKFVSKEACETHKRGWEGALDQLSTELKEH